MQTRSLLHSNPSTGKGNSVAMKLGDRRSTNAVGLGGGCHVDSQARAGGLAGWLETCKKKAGTTRDKQVQWHASRHEGLCR